MNKNLGITIRDEFYKFLEPFNNAISINHGASQLVQLVAYPKSLGLDTELQGEFERLAGLIEDVANIGDEELSTWEGIIHVLLIADDVIEAVGKLDSIVNSLPTNAKDLGKELVEKLFTIYLRSHRPNLFHIASLFTIITPSELKKPIPMEFENGEIVRLTQFNDQIHFDRISEVFSDLANLLKETYLPNNMESGENAHHAAEHLFYHLRKITRYWNLSWREEKVRVGPEPPPTDNDIDEYDDHDDWDVGGDDSEDIEYTPPDHSEYYKNYSPQFSVFSPPIIGPAGSQTNVGLKITASSAEHPEGIKGFIFSPQGNLDWADTLNGWGLDLTVTGSIPEFVFGPDGITGAQGAKARAQFTALSPSLNSNSIFHFGAPEGTRVDIPGFQFLVDLKLDENPELIVSAESKQSILYVQPSDGFLQSIFPENGLQIPFDLGLGWSNKSGFFFTGSAGLTAVLPLHLSLGPLKINTITLDLDVDEHGIRNVISVATEVKIGPLHATIGGIGLSVNGDFKNEADGNFGPLDFNLGLTPPNEIGLTIDTGAVTGGGFLRLDPDKGEYAGSLQLEFAKIGLNAIGILNTKMPDGSKVYSLLLIITAEFTPAIQLGFGFNLSKVGGLFGAHRNVIVDVLRDGLRSNSLGNILFPKDPVNNAPSIISNLSTVFPVQQDRFVFGPMASITWGTPKILTIELGLLIDMPSPLRLIILGRIRMALPTEEAALVKINLDMLGVIDFGEKSIAIDATLFDSRLAAYTLSGDMAMRMTYGNKPMFALAVGGMHPAFNKPSAFPNLDRVAISLSSGNNPRMRLEAYLALTSNTAQVGARLDLYAAAGNWNVSGTLGFDALFQFSPFYFVVDVYGSVALKRKSKHIMGLSVTFTLSGPNQWRAKGKATIKVLLFKGSISFDMTIGQKKPEELQSAEIWPILKSALESDDNWSSELPKEGHAYVIFKEDSSDKVHPLGTIQFRQQVVPFHLEIEKFGNAQPIGANLFSIEGVKANDTESAFSETKESFAPAQYLSLSDSEKLSRPSFEPFTAGAEIQSGAANTSEGILKTLDYEQIIVDGPEEESLLEMKFKLNDNFQKVINRNNSVLGKGFSKAGFARYTAPSIGIKLHEKSYAITDRETMTPIDFNGGSYAESVQQLNRMEAQQTHQVVDQNELLS